MTRKFLVYVVPAMAAAMLVVAVLHVVKAQQPQPRLAPPAPPARAYFSDTVAASGLVEAASENIAVGSALAGVVLDVYVPSSDVGRRVTAGTPLFRVDDRQLKAELALAESKVAAAEAELARLESMPRPEQIPPAEALVRAAEAESMRLKDDYDRAVRLFEQHAVSEQEVVTRGRTYQQATHSLERTRAELALLKAGAWDYDKQVARAAVRQARAEVERIGTEIDRAVVRTPVDGEVLQVSIRVGEYVGTQPGQALVVLGETRPLHVRANVDEQDIPFFVRGAKAVAYVRGDAATRYELRFTRVEPYVVAKRSLTGDNTERIDTRVLPVIYTVAAGDAPLFVGQQVDVFIEANRTAAGAQLSHRGSRYTMQ